jgi:hypothetical protein
VLVRIRTFGPPNGRGARPWTSLAQKARLAWWVGKDDNKTKGYFGGRQREIVLLRIRSHTSSTSFAERIDPSPSLFSSANGGNSHSIKGNEGDFGLLIAALMDSIACLSLSI